MVAGLNQPPLASRRSVSRQSVGRELPPPVRDMASATGPSVILRPYRYNAVTFVDTGYLISVRLPRRAAKRSEVHRVRSHHSLDPFLTGLDGPMFVVTAAHPESGARAGCLVGFATQCSIDPDLFVV